MTKDTRNNLLKNSTGYLGNEFWTHTGYSLSVLKREADKHVREDVGTGCVLALTNNGNATVYARSSSFGVRPSADYTISGFYYVGSGCAGIQIRVKGIEDGSNVILVQDTTYSNGEYKYFSKTIKTSDTVVNMYIEVDNLGGGNNKIVYFGQLMVQEGTVDTGWIQNSNEIAANTVEISENGIIGTYKSSKQNTQVVIEGSTAYFKNNGNNNLMLRGDQTSGKISVYNNGTLVGNIVFNESYDNGGFEIHSEKNYSMVVSNNTGAYIDLTGSNILYKGNLAGSSDLNLKKDINSIDGDTASTIIKNMNPVTFKYKDENDKKHFGLIAQELESVLKNCGISTDDYSIINVNENGDYYVNYIEIIPLLIKAIQNLQEKVNGK